MSTTASSPSSSYGSVGNGNHSNPSPQVLHQRFAVDASLNASGPSESESESEAMFVDGVSDSQSTTARLLEIDDPCNLALVDAEDLFEGTASIGSEVANITKNLLGSGVLSMPGGIAIFSGSYDAFAPASVWTVLLGLMFGYYCILIAKVCDVTKQTSYRGCWEATIGRGSIAITLIQTLLPAQGDLAYATVLSQTMRSLLEGVGIQLSRVTCLVLVTVFMLLPLCLMENLDALAPFSTVGVAGIGITMLAMIVRCLDGSYQPGGKYFDDIEEDQRPEFGDKTESMSLLVLPFICMVFQSWVMHYNSPRFYAELKNRSVPKFTVAVGLSFGLSALFYIAIAVAGFWTFGSHSDSYILNNYSPHDPVASISRLCVGFSVLLTYPLAFFGVRDGCLDMAHVPQEKRTRAFLRNITVIIVSIITTLAVFVSDLGLINAVGGGLFATLLCIVYPSMMYYRAVSMSATKTRGQSIEAAFALILMCIGAGLGAVGTWVSIQES